MQDIKEIDNEEDDFQNPQIEGEREEIKSSEIENVEQDTKSVEIKSQEYIKEPNSQIEGELGVLKALVSKVLMRRNKKKLKMKNRLKNQTLKLKGNEKT